MKYRGVFFLWSIVLVLVGCKKKEEDNKSMATDYHLGELTIVTDDAFKSVSEAIAEAYVISYPDTKVHTRVEKEDLAFLELLKEKERLVVMSRVLSPEEISEYERVLHMKYNPAYFAADAVVFVVGKNSSRTNISMDEIKKELSSEEKRLIFDGTNSGNLNFVAHTLGQKVSDLKYSTLGSNKDVIEQLGKYPDRVGVISLGTISRPYGKEAERLRSMVKILPVREKGKDYMPDPGNLQNQKYPFTRMVYFLTNEAVFGIANGVMRFASGQKGQIVVSKEGLQPYFYYAREVEMR